MPKKDWSRRNFLKTVGVTVPSLKVLLEPQAVFAQGDKDKETFDPDKFTPIDLAPHFTASTTDFGSHELAKQFGGESARDGLLRTPTGEQKLRGIPFRLANNNLPAKCWLALSQAVSSWTVQDVEISIAKKANFICLASFCDWDPNEDPPPGENVVEKVGQLLAEIVISYDDGTEAKSSIRRRFEVNAPALPWGHLSFNSLSHVQDAPRKLTDPLRNGSDWGGLQGTVQDNSYGPDIDDSPAGSMGTLWISAIPNPHPERAIRSVRCRATAPDAIFVCGMTLFHGSESPLRLERLSLYKIGLPEPSSSKPEDWDVEIDLGVVARKYAIPEFQPDIWLHAPDIGLGGAAPSPEGTRYLYAEIAASPNATVTLISKKTGKRYHADLNQTPERQTASAPQATALVQLIERDKVWLNCSVVDAETHRPTPVRIAFRSKDRSYIPPYGHRTEVNDAWFEDYGGDVKLMDSSFSYVGEEFKIELPVGEVFVEITKGFEYKPVRKKLDIKQGDSDLQLEISRFTDLRAKGWVAADTHVHFLSPSTAILEGEAEGLNLINLLAAQWSDLFTNVGDLHQGAITSRNGETLVKVGTENRQHILGHLSSLGAPIFPMSASGPEESYLGDPVWNSIADWSDDCRKQGGLAVAPHFPNPTGEIAADIALGKIEAVEIFQYTPTFNSLPIFDWYRYLNCGYRLPAVGGTDKMGAYMPVGANRVYAYLGEKEFNFPNWSEAVRSGNTFATTGPLLFLQVDGKPPGKEIVISPGGGTIEVQANVQSFVPVHRLELVLNGKVVATQEESAGARELHLKEKIKVDGSAWLAARCSSRLGPTTSWKFAIAAHTSPVYIRVAGEEPFSAQTIAYMLTLIEGSQTWVENLATRADRQRHDRIRKTLNDAKERLHRRLHEHGIPH